MKRLTYREENGRALLTLYGARVYCSTQATAECIAKLEEKLAAYENTGLEPEAIEKLKEDLHVLDLFKEQASDAEESIRIAEARRDGRLIVLPCKVGDTVYWIPNFRERFIFEGKVAGLYFYGRELRISLPELDMEVMYPHPHLFLTREEAEKALEGS